ncbi:hypothetical protein [Nocardioides phosphati]|nr:hypothetical protein [Nocardioides phosphati]
MTSIMRTATEACAAAAASVTAHVVMAVPVWVICLLIVIGLALKFIVDLVVAATPLLVAREETRRAVLLRSAAAPESPSIASALSGVAAMMRRC